MLTLRFPPYYLAANLRSCRDGAPTRLLIKLEFELQRIEEKVVELEIVNNLARYLREVKVPLIVRGGGAQHRAPSLSPVRNGHAGNGSP